MRAFQILFISVALAAELNTTCPHSTEYFDTSLMECASCGTNQVATSDGLGCECSPGYSKTSATRDYPVFECVSCGSSAPAENDYQCIACPSGISTSTGDCQCSAASLQVINEISADGSYLPTKECVACATNYYPGPGTYKCEGCSDITAMTRNSQTYKCECISTGYTQSGDYCVSAAQAGALPSGLTGEDSYTVVYNYVESKSGIGTVSLTQSDTFSYFYLHSARDCQNGYIKACQALANLCVLQMYNLKTNVCQMYQQLGKGKEQMPSDSGWIKEVGWLYYGRTASNVLKDSSVNIKVTFDTGDDTKFHKLTFKAAQYKLDGTFLGFETLADQLLICPHSSQDSITYREFGTNTEYDCSFDLTPYLTSDETIFYDPYILNSDGNLIEVPVLIKNFRDKDDASPNEGSSKSQWQLFRRFFIYDNVSGKVGTNAYANGEVTNVLSYLKSAKLVVTLRADHDEMIYIPYLVLEYRQRQYDYLQSNKKASIDFVSEYTMDTTDYWKVTEGVYIAANVVAIVAWITRLYVWSKNNPSIHSRETYTLWILGKALVYFISTWAFFNFWFIFVSSAYWFVFYKMQYQVYVLVPPNNTWHDNYLAFEIVFGLVVSCQLLTVFDIIRSQSKIDILFIDWETPNRVIKPGHDEINALYNEARLENISSDYYKLSTSAWRSLFIANEFNELQAKRYINLEFTLIFMLFFLGGLGWEQLGDAKPNMHVNVNHETNSPTNMVLRFFVVTFVLLVIGYAQYLIKKIFSLWFPTAIQNFVDLCSVSNVSIFILDQSLHGYYIHGVSPTGMADVGLSDLIKALSQEEAGKARPRGILPEESSGLQTYEIYIPWKMRQTYDNLGTDPVEAEVGEYKKSKIQSQASKLWVKTPAIPKEIDFERLEDVRSELNNRFKTYISTVIKDCKTNILNKSALQRFLNIPPTRMDTLEGSPFFYKDPGMNFESIFFMGKEFSILLMDVLVFNLIDFRHNNLYLAAFITYIFSKMVSYARASLGEYNLSRKTLVDKRFLI
ncbi:unnamed protein product [Blepharisma stoltei]|uniref:Meckelin n=1 Tax=Blepharisma stoltei TaxID=1481888 RepID=A0AAU9II50_9CILI|nr:unnamed protein product [Blepharisma stoltei]